MLPVCHFVTPNALADQPPVYTAPQREISVRVYSGACHRLAWHACACCALLTGGSQTVDDRGKDGTMTPPHGHLGGTMKLPIHVRLCPDEIAAVDACAAA